MNKDLELRFAMDDLNEENNCSFIYENPRYNGWYKKTLKTEEYSEKFVDTIIQFRFPEYLKLYQSALRKFTQEERKIGIHRMLIGSDLQDEVMKMLNFESINEYVKTLSNEDVSKLLERVKKVVTFDCNKIPYLHIRVIDGDTTNYDSVIKKHIESYPEYLKIFYEVLNEKITIEEAELKSNSTILNEFLKIKE